MTAKEQGIQTERYQIIPRVLVFITHKNQVLLIKGAPTKRIWANKYNGIGGHVERGEDIYAAARRETLEETGLQATDFRFKGMITIEAGQPTGIGMFVFTAKADSQETTASAEGTLEWVDVDQALSLNLVEDLHTLLPKVLNAAPAAAPFFGRYWYDADDRLQIQITDLEG
jgi:8-oxo-dGTP diphosphatase